MNLNKAQLIGRVTRAPELKNLQGGQAVTKFSIATNHSYKDKNGEKQESTQFHNIVAWGKLAEVISQWVTKGQEIYVSGRIEYREWDKQDGTKGYMTEIIAEDFQFGAKPKGVGDQREEEGHYAQPPGSAAVAVQNAAATQGYNDGIRLEDIPF